MLRCSVSKRVSVKGSQVISDAVGGLHSKRKVAARIKCHVHDCTYQQLINN